MTSVKYKDVAGFPGYRIGSDGSVWCCRPINGKGDAFGEWRLKKPNRTTRYGHSRVDLYRGRDERHFRYIHRLVLEAFVGPCPDGMECCHNDGDPTNNRIENLRWDTHLANALDREGHGTLPRGEVHRKAILTDEAVRGIRSDRAAGVSRSIVATRYGITPAYVSQIVARKRWRHVS